MKLNQIHMEIQATRVSQALLKKKHKIWAGKVVQQMRVLATKPAGLSSIPETHKAEEPTLPNWPMTSMLAL